MHSSELPDGNIYKQVLNTYNIGFTMKTMIFNVLPNLRGGPDLRIWDASAKKYKKTLVL